MAPTPVSDVVSTPDAKEANDHGCVCPYNGNQNGLGSVTEGVRTYFVNPACPIHADPRWWYSRHLDPIR